MLRLHVWAATLAMIVVLAGMPVFVRPQVDRLRPADAIFVLGGFGKDRYAYGRDLAARGWAPVVVLSNAYDVSHTNVVEPCGPPANQARVLCFDPSPGTTKGEGRELRRLAAQYGWRTVIVVTFRPHLSRARFILGQCFDGDLVMVASPAHVSPLRWAFEYAYQTAGYVRAVVQPGC